MGKLAISICGLLAAMVVIAGCGSSGSSSSSSTGSSESGTTAAETSEPNGSEGGSSGSSALVEEAAENVKPYETEPTEIDVTESLSKKPAGGKTVYFLVGNVPGFAPLVEGYEAAVKPLGWKLVQVPYTAGDPASLDSAMEHAVAEGADFITSAGSPEELFKTQLASAKAKGIPVMNMFTTDEMNGEKTGLYFVVDPGAYYERQGKLLADYIISQSEGKGSEVTINIPEYPVLQAATEAQNKELEKCSECESGVIEVSIEDFSGGKVPNLVTAYLQQHPETEYIVASTGELTTGGLRAALTSAGVGENAKIIGGFPLQTNIEEVAKGNETAYFALAQQEAAWHVVDAMARLSVGDSLEGVEEKFTSTFLQSQENLGSEAKAFEGVPGYEEQFEAIWAGK